MIYQYNNGANNNNNAIIINNNNHNNNDDDYDYDNNNNHSNNHSNNYHRPYHNYTYHLANHHDNDDHRAAYHDPRSYYDDISTSSATSASALGPIPTSSDTDPSSGFPTAAVIGIVVAGVVIVGIAMTVLIMKHHRRQRSHKALEQDDLFDHLPIEPSSPAPLMTVMNGLHMPHDVQQHELEPMYQNGEYNHAHHDYDHHHDHNYHHHDHYDHDPSQQNMQHDGLNQGGNGGFQGDGQGIHQGGNGGFQGDGQGMHQGGSGGFQGDGQGIHQGIQGGNQGFQGGNQGNQGFQPTHQGIQGGNQGFHDPGSQGFTHSQPTTTPGGNGAMGQGPTPGGAIGGGFGGGSQGISNVSPPQHFGAGVGQLPPPINLQTRPSGGFKVRPDSSNQYAILMPASPTITTLSGEGGLVDNTSVPAQGAMTVAPLPLDYRHSITSSNDSWDDRSQDLGYSPHSTQPILNQSRYYDTTSSQYNSGRVFPSPGIATVPVAHSSEVRSPQDSSHEVKFDSVVSTGTVSSLNTIHRRHPQSHEGSEGSGSLFAVSSSASSRNPQDRTPRS
ncbi:hypothetical protein BGX20_003312 [Mortierella sp. AD010]|nr:hypothetical protein BGX20_003312 [Mortierella sp. AD010]